MTLCVCAEANTLQVDIINSLLLLTAKPVIYLVNLSERDYARKKNKWYVPCLLYTSDAADERSR